MLASLEILERMNAQGEVKTAFEELVGISVGGRENLHRHEKILHTMARDHESKGESKAQNTKGEQISYCA